jgi:hypothetical protein
LVRINTHFLWVHDAISFAVMTSPDTHNAHPKKKFEVPWRLNLPHAICEQRDNYVVVERHVGDNGFSRYSSWTLTRRVISQAASCRALHR